MYLYVPIFDMPLINSNFKQTDLELNMLWKLGSRWETQRVVNIKKNH